MIHHRDRKIPSQSVRDEAIEGRIEAGHLIAARSRNEERNVIGEIIDRFSGARVDESEFLRGVSGVERVAITKSSALNAPVDDRRKRDRNISRACPQAHFLRVELLQER